MKSQAHKRGKSAGPSARKKHRQGKEGPGQRASAKSNAQGGRLERLLASKQQRCEGMRVSWGGRGVLCMDGINKSM